MGRQAVAFSATRRILPGMPDLRALAERLRALDASALHVVTMPDFFLDHFVTLPAWQATLPRWEGVHHRGGGNVPTPGQHIQPGGNAANTALALARMGVRTHLVTRTSPFGKAYLEQTLGRFGVDLRHVRGDGHMSITTALEFHEDRPANVMLSDAGSLAQYGPDSLDANDWTLLEAADLVLIANWSQNHQGTPLVEAVSRAARKAGTRTMLDTGDPSHRAGDLGQLLDRVLALPELDVYALNENELRLLTGRALSEGDDEVAAARALHKRRGEGALDLHTARFAATFGPWGEAVVPTFRVKPLRVTGAGDSWNAGNIVGHLAGLAPAQRLLLANAVAGLYVSGPEALAPTLADVVRFLESEPALN